MTGGGPLDDLGWVGVSRPDSTRLGGSGRAKPGAEEMGVGSEPCHFRRSAASVPGPVLGPLGEQHQRPDQGEYRQHRVEKRCEGTTHHYGSEESGPSDPRPG